MTSCEQTGELIEVIRIGADILSVEWQVPNISMLLTGSNNDCASPDFRMGNNSWHLMLCPNWKTKELNPRTGFLRLALWRHAEGQPEAFGFAVGIRGIKRVVGENKMIWMFSDTKRYYWCKIITRDTLMQLKKELMSKDKLRILCTIRKVVPNAVTGPFSDVKGNYYADNKNEGCKNDNRGADNKASKRKSFTQRNIVKNAKSSSTDTEDEDNNVDNNVDEVGRDDKNGCKDDHRASNSKNVQQQNLMKNAKTSLSIMSDVKGHNGDEDDYKDDDKVSKRKNKVRQQNLMKNAKKRFKMLIKDLGRLLFSGENTDVTLQVGDTEFKAHQNILSARSSVLSAMLKNKTPEGTTVKLFVDCKPDVFKEYLFYLYTGSVELLSEQNVFELYRVASNYLADELKEQCLIHIQDILSVQTFCDTVKLALIYGESGLLDQAIDFAEENIRSIVCTKEWQDFNREYPSEANEVLIKALGPPSVDHKSKRQKTEEKPSH